jgi:hypothetical protein
MVQVYRRRYGRDVHPESAQMVLSVLQCLSHVRQLLELSLVMLHKPTKRGEEGSEEEVACLLLCMPKCESCVFVCLLFEGLPAVAPELRIY